MNTNTHTHIEFERVSEAESDYATHEKVMDTETNAHHIKRASDGHI